MKKSLAATSIIESMVVLLIIVSGIVGVFTLLTSSQKLADSTSKRIQAIQIARDGIESFTNIRDTNWLVLAADYENCWNVMNYDITCIGNTSPNSISHNLDQGLIIYRNTNNQFQLENINYSGGVSGYSDSSYRNNFGIQKDIHGFYTQSGGTIYGVAGEPFYTREIRIDYLSHDGISQGPTASSNSSMRVRSIVGWNDSSRGEPQRLEMSTILTNWKGKQ